jgi:putative transposase
VKYAFIKDNLEKYLLQPMLNVLKVAKSGYYAWLKRPKSNQALENEKLSVSIEEVYKESRGNSGSLKVQHGLEARGIKASRPRIARIMKSRGWRGKSHRKFRVTTNSKHKHGFFENHLERKFNAEKPNQKWVSDITYLPTSEGWLYLGVVLLAHKTAPVGLFALDLFSRKVVGWAMGVTLEASLAVQALAMARVTRKPAPGLLHHSDRGVQYASLEFQTQITKLEGISSMSRKGNCWDNAVVESFFSSLKLELDLGKVIGSRAVTKAVVFEWIEVFYNRKRLHSTIGYQSPVEFEEAWTRGEMPNFMSTTS